MLRGPALITNTFLTLALQANTTKKGATVTLTLRMRPFYRISYGWTATGPQWQSTLPTLREYLRCKISHLVAVVPSRPALVMYFFIA